MLLLNCNPVGGVLVTGLVGSVVVETGLVGGGVLVTGLVGSVVVETGLVDGGVLVTGLVDGGVL